MTYYLINGSPRKNCNTSQLLQESLKGIKDSVDSADVEIIHLYDLNYKGCKSCFHCKKIEGKYYGQCPIKDDLRELLPKLWDAEGIIFGTPVYFASVSGELRSLLERFFFAKLVYGGESLIKDKNINIGIIYTMNAGGDGEEEIRKIFDDIIFNPLERSFKYFTDNFYSMKVYDTYQFKDYSKYENYVFDEKKKAKRRREQFPKDLKNAYNLGKQIVKK